MVGKAATQNGWPRGARKNLPQGSTMNRLSVLSDSHADADYLRQELAGIFEVRLVDFEQIPASKPDHYTVVDVDLRDTDRLLHLKKWMKSKPVDGKMIFITDRDSRIETMRAYAVGATDVLHRPIDPKDLLKMLWTDFTALSDGGSDFSTEAPQGVAAAHDSLHRIFSSACLGGPIDQTVINSASNAVVSEIESQGLASWIDTVRKHHSQTYQHCLLVTGLAVAFGQRIGLSQTDRNRLSFAGMLHDVGKARIPVAILEKPGPLDADEMAVMREHPQLGRDALGTAPGLQPEMIDMVIHHHEYLDGSGYPHKLQASEISDLVRMITIADVFGALLERRSYKPPMSGEKAYQILLDMGPKLDQDLVRAFLPISQAG